MAKTTLKSETQFNPAQLDDAEFVVTTDEEGELMIVQES